MEKYIKNIRRCLAEDVEDINSIVNYLNRIHSYGAIQPWFSEKLKEDTQRGNAQSSSAADVLSKMGVSYIASPGLPAAGNSHWMS